MAGPLIGAVVGGFAGYASAGTAWALAGTATASVFANVLAGAQLGFSLGGMLTAPGAQDVQGPRLEDLSVQTSTYGANIPRLYGTVPVLGNVIWLEKDKIREKKKKSGGKGGGGSTTTYKYFATFPVGLCEGPVVGIKRLWIGSNLVYDGGGAGISGVIKSKKQKAYWTLYPGTDDQLPNPRMQADKGADSVSAYPGLAYIVFEDLPLAKYGNSLAGAQVKAEVVMAGSQGTCPAGTALTSTLPTSVNLSSEVLSLGLKSSGMLRVNDGTRIRLYTTAGKHIGVEQTLPEVDGYTPTCSCHNDPDSWLGGAWNSTLGTTWYAIIDKGVAVPETWGGTYARSMIRIGTRLFAITARNVAPNLGTWLWAVENGVVVGQLLLDAGYSVLHYALATDGEYIYVTTPDDTREYTTAPAATGGVWPGIKLHGYSHGGTALCAIGYRKLYGTPHNLANAVYTLNSDGSHTQSCVGGTFPAVRPDGQDYWWTPTHFYASSGGLVSSDVSLADVVEAECLQSRLLEAGDLDVTDLAADMVRGYRLADTASIRGGLEPLQAIWPFDIRMHGYTLQFVRRGNASVATIPAADLDARPAGADPGPLLSQPRDMDSQLPQKAILRYLDVDREYDTGEQTAQRYNTDAVNIAETEIAVVLSAAEAARAEEVLLYTAWRERGADLQFRLPPTYLHLEPADVVTVTDSAGGSHLLRLTAIHYTASGVLECTARREAPAAYTSTAVGDTGDSTGGGIVINGPTLATLMDLPALTAAGDAPGFYAALTGIEEDWPGGTLFRSMDAAQTWTEIESVDSAAVMGGVEAALGAATCFDRFDAAGTLTVTAYSGELASVTELELLAGANHFAYGAHGRWEILAAKTITLNGDGSYTLQDFLRGRLGTEQYASTHQDGDRLVLLGSTDLIFVDMLTAAIGVPGLYRPVTFGEDFEDETDEAFTYAAENLKPRSPIFLNGSRHLTTQDWTLTWVRRARINTEWRDLVDVALDEASEAYEIEIYDGAGYAAVKRTLSATGPTVQYTSAAQIADFGTNPATLYVKVYQISATVGRGHPATGILTSFFNAVSSYLVFGCHADGADESTTFVDVTGKSIAVFGGAKIDTAWSAFGGASGYFDGADDYVAYAASNDFNFGTGKFCVRAKIKPELVTGADRTIVSNFQDATHGWSLYITTTGKLAFNATGNGADVTGTTTLVASTEYDVEVDRDETTLYLWLNGALEASVANSADITSTASLIVGGLYTGGALVTDYKGWVDDWAGYKGLALHTAPFSPPTEPFEY